MKIYIKDYNPMDILKKIKLIDEYYYSTKKSIEIISDDGIFYINDKKFYKMNVVLDKLVELKIKNFDILLDKSVYNNDIVYQLPFSYIDSHITTFYYAINSNKFNKSKIKLVVEGNYDVIHNEICDNEICDNKITDNEIGDNKITDNEIGDNKITDNKDKIIMNKYYNFSPTNFYFETPNEKPDFELLNNDDLNVFLSLLN
jgi:hypothetical protein